MADEIISELTAMVDRTVKNDLKWYRKNTAVPYVLHRLSGTAIIGLSVSLPLVVSLPKELFPTIHSPVSSAKDLVISLIGVLIALISGVNAFFRWGDIWKANMRGMVNLKNRIAVWEIDMLTATNVSNGEVGQRMAIEATRELLSELISIDSKNIEEYVQTLNFPDKHH